MSVLLQQRVSLRDELVEAGARWSQTVRRLVHLAAEFDASDEWAADGAPTCAHWIADALDVEVSTAREWLRIGRALADLAVIDRAFADGRLSYSKVRAVTRVATPDTEADLCGLAERVPARRLACCRNHRRITTRQRRVLHERDRRCVDCGSTDLLECDHHPSYELTKQTIIEQLTVRCANCHHRRHRAADRG
jgi:hypothetical protein